MLEWDRQSQRAAEVVDVGLEVHVERAQPRCRRVQCVPASLGIPARDAVEQEGLEVRRIRGRPRDEARQVEVEALQGRGSAGAPQDRKLDAALPQRTGDGVQGDAWRILQARDVSTLLCPDRGHLVGEQGHAERVSGVGQREEERLDGGHGRLGAARPPAAVQGQLVAGDRLPDGRLGRRCNASILEHGSLRLLQQPVVVRVPLKYAAAESLHKCAVQGLGFAGHADGDAAHKMPHVQSHRHALPPLEDPDQLRRPVLRAAVSVGVQQQGMQLSRPAVPIDEAPREWLQSVGALGLGEDRDEDLASLVADVRRPSRRVGTGALQLPAHLLGRIDLNDPTEGGGHCSLKRGESGPDVSHVGGQEPLGRVEQLGLWRRLELGHAAAAVRVVACLEADAVVQVLRHLAQVCLAVCLLQDVPHGCRTVAEGPSTESGDHGSVARVLVREYNWEARANPLGQLVEDAQVPGDEGTLT